METRSQLLQDLANCYAIMDSIDVNDRWKNIDKSVNEQVTIEIRSLLETLKEDS